MSVRRGQFLVVEDGARVRVVKGSVHLYHSTVHLDLSPTSKQITTSSKAHMVRKRHQLEYFKGLSSPIQKVSSFSDRLDFYLQDVVSASCVGFCSLGDKGERGGGVDVVLVSNI